MTLLGWRMEERKEKKEKREERNATEKMRINSVKTALGGEQKGPKLSTCFLFVVYSPLR